MEMLIGAGGGGGVDSGSALLYKPSIGLEYNLNDNFSFKLHRKSTSKEGNLMPIPLTLARFGVLGLQNKALNL